MVLSFFPFFIYPVACRGIEEVTLLKPQGKRAKNLSSPKEMERGFFFALVLSYNDFMKRENLNVSRLMTSQPWRKHVSGRDLELDHLACWSKILLRMFISCFLI